MAKMKHISRKTLVESEGQLHTVGNNRQVQYLNKVFHGFLHGHNILQFCPFDMKLCIDDCGFPTRTTMMAINDFIEFFEISARVSYAKGKTTLYWENAEISGPYGQPITITINVHGVAA